VPAQRLTRQIIADETVQPLRITKRISGNTVALEERWCSTSV
jgi:hypothetical protein